MHKLPLKAHESSGPHTEKIKMVTKRDGSQEPFCPEKLQQDLSELLKDLDTAYINLDIILGKVLVGLPSSKYPCDLT